MSLNLSKIKTAIAAAKYAPKKKLKEKQPLDYATSLYLRRRKIKDFNELQDMRPRSKGVYTLNIKERQEVLDVLYPFIHEFFITRIKYRKMPKRSQNDARMYLVEYFSTRCNSMGKQIFDAIMEGTDKQFTKSEIVNALINTVYRNRLDYLSFMFKPYDPKKVPDEKVVSIWDKISEVGHA